MNILIITKVNKWENRLMTYLIRFMIFFIISFVVLSLFSLVIIFSVKGYFIYEERYLFWNILNAIMISLSSILIPLLYQYSKSQREGRLRNRVKIGSFFEIFAIIFLAIIFLIIPYVNLDFFMMIFIAIGMLMALIGVFFGFI